MWGVDALAQAGLTPRTVDAIAAGRSSDPLRASGFSDCVGRDSTASQSASLGMSRESINGGLAELGVGSSILGGRVSSSAAADAGAPASSAAAAAYINPYSSVSPRLSAARSPLYSALNLGAKELGGESARRLSSASPALTATPRTSLLLASLGCCGSNGATPRMSGIPGTPTSMSLGATPRSTSFSAIMGECCGHDDFGLGSPARGAAAMHDALSKGMGSMAAPPPRPPAPAAPAADGRGSGSGGGSDALRTLLGSGLF